MKKMMRFLTYMMVIVMLLTVMVVPGFATGIRRPLSGTENLTPTTEPSNSSGVFQRPIKGTENLTPTTEPSSGSTGSGVIQRPIRGEENLIPTTEPSSSSTGSGVPQRPIKGEENLIPTTEPSSNNTGSGVIERPIKGEENLVPTTSPVTGTLPEKNIPSGTTSANTSTTKPTESTQKSAASSKSPYFTKHPTDESVKAGTNAQFVAIAEHADGYHWIIMSADGRDTYTIAEACSNFKGLKAEGSLTTRLTLYYIPASLDGYYVACIAEGNGETVTSNGALVTVQGQKKAAQAVETQPVTVPATEAVIAPNTETTEAAVFMETNPTQMIETAEVTETPATEAAEEQEEKQPLGLYFVGGICIVLLLAAIILMLVLLKTLRKGKRR